LILVRKFGGLILTLLAVAFLTFLLTSLLPGNPALAMLGPSGVSAKAIAAVDAELGLNHSIIVRFWIWLGHVLHGNLGYSYANNMSVRTELAQYLPVTLELIVLAMVISLVLAIPGGVFTAYRAGRPVDQVSSGLTFVLIGIPSFVMALLLIYVFAVKFHLFPASGWVPLTQNPAENLRYAFLPAFTLALSQVAIFMRLLRGDMITTLNEDYVSLARSKGISTPRLLFRHAFRPSSFSLVTVVGLQVGFLLGGTVIVENLFAAPGIGMLLVQAIEARDLVTVQGITLFIAVAFVLVNFAVDLLYSVLDPRIRRGSASLATA
jgi:peptide/nickel transport system permease protein